MIIGYVFTGAFAGMIAAAIAAVSGASVGLICSLYVLVGAAVVVFLAGLQFVRVLLADRRQIGSAARGNTSQSLSGSKHMSSHRADDTALRILAVDDDPFILDLIGVIAGHAGLTDVVRVSSGEQALMLLAAADQTFDYFLFDIHMPGIDGLELCRRVRQVSRYRDTPITMLTAMRDVAYMNEAFRAGASDYVMKPFDVAELELRLRLAQDAYVAGYNAPSAARKGGEGSSLHLITGGFERLGDLWRNRRHHLVDRVALSNYLTQVPQKDLSDVRVFAVLIGQTPVRHADVMQEAHTGLHEAIAAAAADSLGPDLAIMAYTRDADLLIVTHCTHPLRALSLELDIARRLADQATGQEDTGSGELVISVGGPVQLQGAKEGRATFATDRALMLAEDRISHKQGRSLTALHKT